MDESDGGRDARVDRIKGLIAPTLEAMGYDLVRALVSGRHNPLLQVMAERKDGRAMHVDHCVEISHTLSALLEAADPIAGSYTLEVSSPGLDRPLMKPADYARFAGRAAKIETVRPLDGRRRFHGRLAGIDGETVRLETPDGPVAIAFADIVRARLVVDDKAMQDALRHETGGGESKPGDAGTDTESKSGRRRPKRNTRRG